MRRRTPPRRWQRISGRWSGFLTRPVSTASSASGKNARGWLAKNLGNSAAARLIAKAKGTDPESERRAIRRERKRWDKKVNPHPATRRE